MCFTPSTPHPLQEGLISGAQCRPSPSALWDRVQELEDELDRVRR